MSGGQDTDFRGQAHRRIIRRLDEVQAWFRRKIQGRPVPFYAGFDIRDSSEKIAPVDANLFPAGFNNICDTDREKSARLMGDWLKSRLNGTGKTVLLLAEEHTNNLYYWDNIYIIKSLIEEGGFKVKICVPGAVLKEERRLETASGRRIAVSPLKGEKGDLIVSNNDFSANCALPPDIPCEPAPSLGWNKRRKDRFFRFYNQAAGEFASLIGADPWRWTIETQRFAPFDPASKDSLKELKEAVRVFLQGLKERRPASSENPPFVFLKNSSGTYGLGVTAVSRPEEVENWNHKTRKIMKAAKGGGGFKELIIQEGVPTSVADREGLTAEPVIYMSGAELAGGFLRSHRKKNERSNLNSPGAVYKRLCISDLEVKISGCIMENVYGWTARLGLLAVMEEMRRLPL